MKTIRLKQEIDNCLSRGPRSFNEILEHVNTNTRHGTSRFALGPVLGNYYKKLPNDKEYEPHYYVKLTDEPVMVKVRQPQFYQCDDKFTCRFCVEIRKAKGLDQAILADQHQALDEGFKPWR